MSARGGTSWWLPRLLDDETLDATETLLMIALADYVNADDQCWPSIDTLSRRARCSYATARRRLASLEATGRIERVRRMRAHGEMGTYLFTLVRTPALSLSDGEPSTSAHDAERQASAHLDERAEPPTDEPPKKEHTTTSTAAQPTLVLVEDDLIGESFALWWDRYPKRNGKRVGRKQAEQQWRRLKPPERTAAARAVEHYRAACDGGLTIAKDAHRWLRDRAWDEWQEPAVDDRRRGPGPSPGRRASNDAWRDGGGFK
jgi:hypothetical protein